MTGTPFRIALLPFDIKWACIWITSHTVKNVDYTYLILWVHARHCPAWVCLVSPWSGVTIFLCPLENPTSSSSLTSHVPWLPRDQWYHVYQTRYTSRKYPRPPGHTELLEKQFASLKKSVPIPPSPRRFLRCSSDSDSHTRAALFFFSSLARHLKSSRSVQMVVVNIL